jgi:hypothetical protein
VAVAVGLRGTESLTAVLRLARLEGGECFRIALRGLAIDEIGDVAARRQRLRAPELLTHALALHHQPLNDRSPDLVIPLQCDIRHG